EALRQARAEEARRREAEPTRGEQARAALWRALVAEGTERLGGEPVPVPRPDLFAAPPEQWQGACSVAASRISGAITIRTPVTVAVFRIVKDRYRT
ncbi:MAG TPA: hypothetical protein VD902_07795, partial [Symbiobacteriaceae bacterium]|nr:hypothetical protein [Symbiobacteriaceae bacterium]